VPKDERKVGHNQFESGYAQRLSRLHATVPAIRVKVYTTDPKVAGAAVTCSARDLGSLEYFLRRLSQVVTLPHNTGAIRKLYSLDESEITDGTELADGEEYIVVGTFQGQLTHVRRRIALLDSQETDKAMLSSPTEQLRERTLSFGPNKPRGRRSSRSPTKEWERTPSRTPSRSPTKQRELTVLSMHSSKSTVGGSVGLPAIHRVGTKAELRPPPTAGTLTRERTLPRIGGNSRKEEKPSRLLQKLRGHRPRLVEVSHDPESLHWLWEDLEGKYVDTDGSPTVSLASLVDLMTKTEPVLSKPYAWEYAYSVLNQRKDSCISTVTPAAVGTICEAVLHVTMAMVATGSMSNVSHPVDLGTFRAAIDALFTGDSDQTWRSLSADATDQAFEFIARTTRANDIGFTADSFHLWYLQRMMPTVAWARTLGPTGSVQSLAGVPLGPDAAGAYDTDDEDGLAEDDGLYVRARESHTALAGTATLTKKQAKLLKGVFSRTTRDVNSLIRDQPQCEALFDEIDTGVCGVVTLFSANAVLASQFPILSHKGALLCGFRIATGRQGNSILDQDGAMVELLGDTWVCRHEMQPLIRSVFYANKVFRTLGIQGDGEGISVTLQEFQRVIKVLGLKLGEMKVLSKFEHIVQSGRQGSTLEPRATVTVDQLCAWYSRERCALPLDTADAREMQGTSAGSRSVAEAHVTLVQMSKTASFYHLLSGMWRAVWPGQEDGFEGLSTPEVVGRMIGASDSLEAEGDTKSTVFSGLSHSDAAELHDPTVYMLQRGNSKAKLNLVDAKGCVAHYVARAVVMERFHSVANDANVSVAEFMQLGRDLAPRMSKVELTTAYATLLDDAQQARASDRGSFRGARISRVPATTVRQWLEIQGTETFRVLLSLSTLDRWMHAVAIERSRLESLFCAADVDFNGEISATEFETVVNALVPRPDSILPSPYGDTSWDFEMVDAGFDLIDGNGRRRFRRTLFTLLATAVVSRLAHVGVDNVDNCVVSYRLFHLCADFFGLPTDHALGGFATTFQRLLKREIGSGETIDMDQAVSVRVAAVHLGKAAFLNYSSSF
jgi:hypothetical protein